jgi:hypothetical protein
MDRAGLAWKSGHWTNRISGWKIKRGEMAEWSKAPDCVRYEIPGFFSRFSF